MNTNLKTIADNQIAHYLKVRADFADSLAVMGTVYTLRHLSERAAIAEYAYRIGNDLKHILEGDDAEQRVESYIISLNRRLRQTAEGGNLDGEYGKHEAAAIAKVLELIDPIPYK